MGCSSPAASALRARTAVEKDRRALDRGIASVELRRGRVVVVNGVRAVAKMREDEIDAVLALQGPGAARVLTRLPPQELRSRCLMRENTEVRDRLMPEVYDVPAMSLRSYADVTCFPRQVAVQRNLLLPDSFRHNAAPRLHSTALTDLGPSFSEVPRGMNRAERLSGAYYYLDSEWPRHFGHAMTEQMARLWAVEEARKELPDLKAIVSRRRRAGLAECAGEIFGSVGFSESDVVVHHRPVQVEHLLAASPMLSMPRHVHPGLAELWGGIGETLAARSAATFAGRIFCSRRRSRRDCLNAHEVEELRGTRVHRGLPREDAVR